MTLPAITPFVNPPDRAAAGSDFGTALAAWIGDMNVSVASMNAFKAALLADIPALASLPVGGECRLDLSGSTLLLSRFNGYRLIIDDAVRVIPEAGVTLVTTAVANTLYYIYAYWTGTALVLEASSTVPAYDARNGVAIKTGAATRSLVGMARTNAAGVWEDSTTNRLVLSYYNRNPKLCRSGTSTGEVSSSNATTPILLSASLKVGVLSWGENINVVISTQYKNTTVTGGFSLLYSNGTSISSNPYNLSAINSYDYFVSFGTLQLSVGYTYVDLYVKPWSGTGTWDTSGGKIAFSIMG